MSELNLANSLFKGLNDQQGLMICGYEWGWSKEDQKKVEEPYIDDSIECTFSNKSLRYGEQAKQWRYDKAIRKWFSLWGHPLNENGLGTDFDKCIVQTNWANSCNNNINDYVKFLEENHINNFIKHVEELKPKIIIFMGRHLINLLRNEKVWDRFTAIVGQQIEPLQTIQKTEYDGRRFKIFFNNFENCKVICLPHPSSSRGLSDEYIKLFKPEMDAIFSEFKQERSIIV
ncbi:hypothetical protein [Acinetobacter sp. ANC 5502]